MGVYVQQNGKLVPIAGNGGGTSPEVEAKLTELESLIQQTQALRADLETYGMVKLSDSSAVTDSTGLALPATEKNAGIEGTLAGEIASIRNEAKRNMVMAGSECRVYISNDGNDSTGKIGNSSYPFATLNGALIDTGYIHRYNCFYVFLKSSADASKVHTYGFKDIPLYQKTVMFKGYNYLGPETRGNKPYLELDNIDAVDSNLYFESVNINAVSLNSAARIYGNCTVSLGGYEGIEVQLTNGAIFKIVEGGDGSKRAVRLTVLMSRVTTKSEVADSKFGPFHFNSSVPTNYGVPYISITTWECKLFNDTLVSKLDPTSSFPVTWNDFDKKDNGASSRFEYY